MLRGQRSSYEARCHHRRRSAEGRQASSSRPFRGKGTVLRRMRRRPRGCRREELCGLVTGKADVSSLEPSPVVLPRNCPGPGFLGTGGPYLRRTNGVAEVYVSDSEPLSRHQPPCFATGRAGEVTQGRAADCPSLRLPRPRPSAARPWKRAPGFARSRWIPATVARVYSTHDAAAKGGPTGRQNRKQ